MTGSRCAVLLLFGFVLAILGPGAATGSTLYGDDFSDFRSTFRKPAGLRLQQDSDGATLSARNRPLGRIVSRGVIDLDDISGISISTTALSGGFGLSALYLNGRNRVVGMQGLLSVTEVGTAHLDGSALLPPDQARRLRLVLNLPARGVVTFSHLAVTTPEPGTFPLLAAGLLVVAHRARRRLRRRAACGSSAGKARLPARQAFGPA